MYRVSPCQKRKSASPVRNVLKKKVMESFVVQTNSGPSTLDSCLRGLRMFKACSFGFLQRGELQRLCKPVRVHTVHYKGFPVPFIHICTPRLLRR